MHGCTRLAGLTAPALLLALALVTWTAPAALALPEAAAHNATPGEPGEPSVPEAPGAQMDTPQENTPLIEGAFGYVLGERWPGEASPAEPGLLKAEVPPLVDSGLFDFHSLWLDPQSHEIVQISASRAFQHSQDAEKAHLALVGLLTGKYGQPRTEQLRQVFAAQGRSVHVLMSLEGDMALLGVVYQDDRATAAAITRPRFDLTLPDIPGVNDNADNATGQ